MITISGKSATLGASRVEQILAPALASLNLESEYRVVIGGKNEQRAEIQGKLSAEVPFALFLMRILLTTVLGLVPMTPDFDLVTHGGQKRRLLNFASDCMVLELGSMTCPLFLTRQDSMERTA